MSEPLTFLASIAPLQSAITIASDGGARVKIDIPESEMPAIVRLMLMRGGEADYHQQMNAFLSDVAAALQARFPAFIPARPPIQIAIVQLAEPQ